jgi:PIN domain nuclease of toxin-antitoxin system
VLDTHALWWLAVEQNRLGRKAQRLADLALSRGELRVSAISFWEISILMLKGRLRLSQPVASLRQGLLRAGLRDIPLDGEIAIRATDFGNLHHDPADRFILASALLGNATLITADEAILRWRGEVKRLDARK